MANEIDNSLVIQFSDMIHVQAQQIKARLRPYVKVKKMTGDIWAYDGLGQVEATEVVGRIQPTVFNSIDHLRRKIRRRRFVVTLPIDASDVRGALLNPEGEYAGACVRAMERVFDRVGIEAAFANVFTGREMDTEVTAANDGVVTVNATAGLTYEKLLEIRSNWTDKEVGTQTPESFLLMGTNDEMVALMKETELTSGDFSRQYVVDKGEITKAVGLDLVFYGAGVNSPLLSVSSSTRDCIAMTGRGLIYGMSADVKLEVAKRHDYVEVTQIQMVIELGAVRTEGVLVQKVQTTST